MAKQKQAAKATKKPVTKKAAKPIAKKAATKAKAGKKTAASVASKSAGKTSSKRELGIKVREVVKSVNPKINLTEDAVELLNALLLEKFTQIAETAAKIVNKAKQENLDCDDVKKAVN